MATSVPGDKFVQTLKGLQSMCLPSDTGIVSTPSLKIELKPPVLFRLIKVGEDYGSTTCLEAYFRIFVLHLEKGTLKEDETIEFLNSLYP